MERKVDGTQALTIQPVNIDTEEVKIHREYVKAALGGFCAQMPKETLRAIEENAGSYYVEAAFAIADKAVEMEKKRGTL